MLKKDFLIENAPDNPGIARINHNTPDCRGGSKSLRIQRNSDGTIFGKCFRCGEWGMVKAQKSYFPVEEQEATTTKEKFITNIEDWPGKAQAWIKQYGLTEDELQWEGIAYSVRQRRVILPIHWNSEVIGYQARKIYDDDPGPKYITYAKAPPGNIIYHPEDSREICIVEDIISSIKVGRVLDSVALLSTNINSKLLEHLTDYSKFYIWLDMDNPQVIRQGLKLLKILGNMGETKLIKTPKDPKYYTTDEVKSILYGT